MPRFRKFHTAFNAALCLLPLLLCACNGSGGNYPTDWPPLAKKRSAHGCSDLRGTYVFDEIHRDYDATTFSVLSTFLGAGVTQVYNAPLLSFTIAGDAETALTITFTRAPSTLSKDSPSAPERQTVTALRGVAYTCDDGWLVGKAKQDLRVSYPKHNHHDYKVVDYRLSSMGPQIVRLRRDVEGGLVGRTHVREALIFTTWAETGAGIPYGFETNTYWTRWTPTEPTPAPGDVVAPRTLQRIKRQEYDQEHGPGSYAAVLAAANGKSPTAPAASAPPAAPQTVADMRARVAQHIDSNASLEDLHREDDRYVVTLRVTARGQITRSIERLSEDAAFADIQDHGVITSAGQKDLAMISFKQRR